MMPDDKSDQLHEKKNICACLASVFTLELNVTINPFTTSLLGSKENSPNWCL